MYLVRLIHHGFLLFALIKFCSLQHPCLLSQYLFNLADFPDLRWVKLVPGKANFSMIVGVGFFIFLLEGCFCAFMLLVG